MFGKTMNYSDHDFEAIKILKNFLPDKIFDAHAHLFSTNKSIPQIRERLGYELSLNSEKYLAEMSELLCNPKKMRLNLIDFPEAAGKLNFEEYISKSDDFLIEELNKDSGYVGEIIVSPRDTVETIEKRIARHPNIRGFKCYHVFAPKEATWNCDIEEYLPEAAWEVANRKNMVITLHMVKELSFADESNQRYIIEMAKKYPNATLILAHAARSFASWTGIESIHKVAKIENVWFDFSAVCESSAMFQIMRKAGIQRCMWGSDYMVCRGRGKAISLADGFCWLYQSEIDKISSITPISTWLIGTENLMAVRQACILAEMKETQVEDLFYNNAARLFDKR